MACFISPIVSLSLPTTVMVNSLLVCMNFLIQSTSPFKSFKWLKCKTKWVPLSIVVKLVRYFVLTLWNTKTYPYIGALIKWFSFQVMNCFNSNIVVITTRKQLLISLDVTKNSDDQSERRSAVKEGNTPYDTDTWNIHNSKPNYTFNKCTDYSLFC